MSEDKAEYWWKQWDASRTYANKLHKELCDVKADRDKLQCEVHLLRTQAGILSQDDILAASPGRRQIEERLAQQAKFNQEIEAMIYGLRARVTVLEEKVKS